MNEQHTKTELTHLPDKSAKKSGNSFQRLYTQMLQSELYQIFVVRPKKNLLSRIIRGVLIVMLIPGYVSLTELLTPPLRPEELKVAKGIYEKYARGARSGGNLIIKYDNGKIDKFRDTPEDEVLQKLDKLKGKLITVHYSYSIHPFLYRYKILQGINYDDEIISGGYNQAKYQRLLFIRKVDKFIVSIWFGVTLIGLIVTYLVNRNNNYHKENH